MRYARFVSESLLTKQVEPNTAPTIQQSAKVIFDRFRGAQASASKALNVDRSAIALWFQGRVQSKRLDIAIPAFAAGLEHGATHAD